MSKARRPRHQRHGGKTSPTRMPAVPPADEAILEQASPEPMPEPVAPAPQDEPTALAAEAAPSEIFEADAVPPPLPALARDTGVQETAQAAALPAISLAPVTARLGAESFGTTIMSYFVGEGEAMGAHWRALAGARSMAEIVRLQIGEFQRAADATLTCWGMLALAAGRSIAPR